MTIPLKCIGYDQDGKGFDCPNDAGTPWTPLWCPECDERRKERISRQMDEILASFGTQQS